MKNWFFEHLLIFQKDSRIGRLDFLLNLIVWKIIEVMLLMILGFIFGLFFVLLGTTSNVEEIIKNFFVILICSYIGFFIIKARCYDIGENFKTSVVFASFVIIADIVSFLTPDSSSLHLSCVGISSIIILTLLFVRGKNFKNNNKTVIKETLFNNIEGKSK